MWDGLTVITEASMDGSEEERLGGHRAKQVGQALEGGSLDEAKGGSCCFY